MKINILKPFGPSIVKFSISEELIQQLNNYTEDVINNNIKSEELDHSKKLAGQVTQEILLEKNFMQKIKLGELLSSICKKWLNIEDNQKNLQNFQILNSWIVRQFQNEYNPVHWHTGHVSGVGYLKVPKENKKIIKKDINTDGKLVLIDGSKNLFSKGIYEITPKIGDFYMFPNNLMHTVYPFYGTNEERRSISFNAVMDLKSSIY